MIDASMKQKLPANLDELVQKNLMAGEEILLCLKGAFKEALVCTDRRVMIVKSGFMTGQTFGSDMFQLAYGNVASAQVQFHFLTGYFEISAGGMQNTAKSYWSNSKETNASKAPNCVSIGGKPQAESFRAACAFILERAERGRSADRSEPDIAESLSKLWKLKTEGALDQKEYDDAKRRLLGK